MGKMKFAAGYLGLGLLLAACNGGGDGGTAPTAAELTGKWLLREVATKGRMSMKFPPIIDMDTTWDTTESYTGSTYYLDFKADNTYESNMPESETPGDLEKVAASRVLETGTWSLEGKVLTTVSNPDKDTAKMNVTLEDGNLMARFSFDTTYSDSGMSMTIKSDMAAKLVK
jgi:hypothetical protein